MIFTSIDRSARITKAITICALFLSLEAWLTPNNCMAWQSGSRSPTPAASPSVAPQQPSFGTPSAQPAPIQNFSNPIQFPQNNFGTPPAGVNPNGFSQGIPTQGIPTQGVPLNQGTALNQGVPLNQGIQLDQGFNQGIPMDQGMPFNQGIVSQGSDSTQGSGSTQTMPTQSTQQSSASQSGGSSSPGIPDSSVVDPIFEINNPSSMIGVDHSIWNAFLAKHVAPDSQGINRVCYKRVTCEDMQLLQSYLN